MFFSLFFLFFIYIHNIFKQINFLKEYTGEDDSDLYLEERETALRLAQEEKRLQQMAVPGILNPHEIPEEMQD